jgi:hypothetical protein
MPGGEPWRSSLAGSATVSFPADAVIRGLTGSRRMMRANFGPDQGCRFGDALIQLPRVLADLVLTAGSCG